VFRRSASASASAALVVALLAGAPLLTACGTPRAGAAAVIGGEQITVSALQAKVGQVRKAQEASPNAAQLVQQSGNLTGATLNSMVLDRIVAKALDDAGMTVSRAELQRFRSGQEKAAGGQKALERALLERYGIAPQQVDDFYRTQVGVEKLAKQSGVTSATPQGQEKLRALLEKTGRELSIDVNPRYGSWKADQLMLTPTTEKWLKPKKPQA
jgi:SurA N-terminal domain